MPLRHQNSLPPIAVMGAGSWGTALAMVLAQRGQNVRLWGRNPERVAQMSEQRSNSHYLPGCPFPTTLSVTADIREAVRNVRDILIVVPSHAFREHLIDLLPFLDHDSRIVWATKGLDPSTGKLLHEVVEEIVAWPIATAVLAGPSFAAEVARNLPTAVTIASQNSDFSNELVERFHTPTFRAYINVDIIGVQISGAVKNPLAVAAGISDGLGYGANARCALITRALAEMSRLGIAMGGRMETFMGLSGLGDLVLTCTGSQSRNWRFGNALGQGHPIDQAEREVGQVVEGRQNAIIVAKRAKALGIEMPIIEQVSKVVQGKITAAEAVQALLMRSVKFE
jgi:glycerol-3-phosphate dehydrogenase (NAD(P)+)